MEGNGAQVSGYAVQQGMVSKQRWNDGGINPPAPSTLAAVPPPLEILKSITELLETAHQRVSELDHRVSAVTIPSPSQKSGPGDLAREGAPTTLQGQLIGVARMVAELNDRIADLNRRIIL